MVGLTEVLAHQGGWDEVLLVATPIVIFVVLLRIANARAAHQEGPSAADDHGPGGPGPQPGADQADLRSDPGGSPSGDCR